MDSESELDPTDEAVAQLQSLGLSTYAARTLVALVSLGGGATARDVSDVAEVPRTRVYDAVDELQDLGLVDVEESSPKRFWASSPVSTARVLHRRHRERTASLADALSAVASDEVLQSPDDLWHDVGDGTILRRVERLVRAAEEDVVLLTTAEVTDQVVDALVNAAGDGASVTVIADSAEACDRVREAIPNADVDTSRGYWTESPLTRLLVADDTALLSVRVESDAARDATEAAIWATGLENGLHTVLSELVAWEFDDRCV